MLQNKPGHVIIKCNYKTLMPSPPVCKIPEGKNLCLAQKFNQYQNIIGTQ